MRNASQFNFGVIIQQLQRDFFPCVAERVVDLAKATSLDGPLDGVAVERPGFRLMSELHGGTCPRRQSEVEC